MVLTAYPQQLVPFRQGQSNLKVFLTFDENKQVYMFCEKNEKGFPVPRELPLGISRVQLDDNASKRLWLKRNFEKEIEALSEKQEVSMRNASMRYGELSFPYYEKNKYEYNDQFGLIRV
ncbi:hypothetical protein [Coxiella burnetii]|uniref:hypothetical protein n=1 Tax=Coxiella burnetii TaxID=777 RepID=UPI0009B7F71A|nr:hypothetical protein [Coxiella burnetii]